MKADARLLKLERRALTALLQRYREWKREYPEGPWPANRGGPKGLQRKLLLATIALHGAKQGKHK